MQANVPIGRISWSLSKGYYDTYPDDETDKEVKVYCDRLAHPDDPPHVYIGWCNGVFPNGMIVMQAVHLTGMPGSYAHHIPNAMPRTRAAVYDFPSWSLGTFTRVDRDKIIEAGKAVRFRRNSTANRCRAWMWDLLEGLVARKLITQDLADQIFREAPLVERVPEAEPAKDATMKGAMKDMTLAV